MNAHSAHLTVTGMVSALSPKQGLLKSNKPTFLMDVLAIKQDRGEDCTDFRLVMREFSSGKCATIEGALHQMKHMTKARKSWVPEQQHERRLAFIADLERTLTDYAMYRAQCEAAGVPADAEPRSAS